VSAERRVIEGMTILEGTEYLTFGLCLLPFDLRSAHLVEFGAPALSDVEGPRVGDLEVYGLQSPVYGD
jgi:hypothetical protein